MTQENRQLLLVDLCARIAYGVKVWYKYYPDNVTERFATSIRLADGKIALSSKFNREGDWYLIEEANELLIKPYLRPMSSMTEEESAELSNIISEWFDKELFYLTEEPFLEYALSKINYSISPQLFDWLNAHHFDYRGLIAKGLAIEVTKENNPYKN